MTARRPRRRRPPARHGAPTLVGAPSHVRGMSEALAARAGVGGAEPEVVVFRGLGRERSHLGSAQRVGPATRSGAPRSKRRARPLGVAGANEAAAPAPSGRSSRPPPGTRPRLSGATNRAGPLAGPPRRRRRRPGALRCRTAAARFNRRGRGRTFHDPDAHHL